MLRLSNLSGSDSHVMWRLDIPVRFRSTRESALSLVEVIIGIGIIVTVLLVSLALLGSNLQQSQQVAEDQDLLAAIAAVRSYLNNADFSETEAALTQGKPLVVLFYLAENAVGTTNWDAPVASPLGDTDRLLLTASPNVKAFSASATNLPVYISASRAAPYLAYLVASPLQPTSSGTSTVKASLVAQVLFYRYRPAETLLQQLNASRPVRAPDFVVTMIVRP